MATVVERLFGVRVPRLARNAGHFGASVLLASATVSVEPGSFILPLVPLSSMTRISIASVAARVWVMRTRRFILEPRKVSGRATGPKELVSTPRETRRDRASNTEPLAASGGTV